MYRISGKVSHVRTCQECFTKNTAPEPTTDKARERKCSTCQSPALDYGSPYVKYNGKLYRMTTLMEYAEAGEVFVVNDSEMYMIETGDES